jgi:hypothetical protein
MTVRNVIARLTAFRAPIFILKGVDEKQRRRQEAVESGGG